MIIAEPLAYMLRETRRERLAESSLLAEAVRWFEHCRMLRYFENEHLLGQPNEESRRAHRVVVSDLIADGELLAWQARCERVDFSTAGFKVEDIEAETRLLRDSFALFHEPMPADEAEQILESAFGQRTA